MDEEIVFGVDCSPGVFAGYVFYESDGFLIFCVYEVFNDESIGELLFDPGFFGEIAGVFWVEKAFWWILGYIVFSELYDFYIWHILGVMSLVIFSNCRRFLAKGLLESCVFVT